MALTRFSRRATEGLAAGDKHPEALGHCQEACHVRRRLQDMLEVVQDEEGPAPAQNRPQVLHGGDPRGDADAERPGHGRHHERRFRDGGQVRKDHAVGERLPAPTAALRLRREAFTSGRPPLRGRAGLAYGAVTAYSSGAMMMAMTAISFSRMFREGPAVSLKGSPTVSPTTDAL